MKGELIVVVFVSFLLVSVIPLVSANILTDIADWFKSLFGFEPSLSPAEETITLYPSYDGFVYEDDEEWGRQVQANYINLYWNGFVEFDTSSIPDDAVITDVKFNFYVTDSCDGACGVGLKGMAGKKINDLVRYPNTFDGNLDIFQRSLYLSEKINDEPWSSNLFVFETKAPYNPSTMDWPQFQHGPQHTGCYDCGPKPRLPSIIENTNTSIFNLDLVMKVKKVDNGVWNDYRTVIEKKHGIYGNEHIDLAELWNDENVMINELGDYQVYAAVIDNNRNVLRDGNNNLLESSWDFAVREEIIGQEPVCGNGIIETGEQCDDGNIANGDGCSSSCQTEDTNVTTTPGTGVAPVSSGTSGSGGGGGGGGGGSSGGAKVTLNNALVDFNDISWQNVGTATETQLSSSEGSSISLSGGQRATLPENHGISVLEITAQTAKIVVSSVPQEAVMTIGEKRKFDINNDNKYDLEVTLTNIENGKANFSIISINQTITNEIEQQQQIQENNAENIHTSLPFISLAELKASPYFKVIVAVLVVLIVAVIGLIVYFVRKRK